jgi:hypothetical protein
MESTVAFSPSRLKRHQQARRGGRRLGGGGGVGGGGGEGEEERGANVGLILEIPDALAGQLDLEQEPEPEPGPEPEPEPDVKAGSTSQPPQKQQAQRSRHQAAILEAKDAEISTMQKQFEAAKTQILKQQRQLAKYKALIQEQQQTLTGLKNENIELASVGKASSVLASSPFGPLGGGSFNSAPSSPTQDVMANENTDPANNNGSNPSDNSGAFKTMKNWWAGEDEDKKEEVELEKEVGAVALRRKSNTAPMEGVVKEKAEARSAPFRNRLIGLLSSIEKEAKDYNSLKERIKVENREQRSNRRASVTAAERRASRAAAGLPPRNGESTPNRVDSDENLMSKTLDARIGGVKIEEEEIVGRLVQSQSFSEIPVDPD